MFARRLLSGIFLLLAVLLASGFIASCANGGSGSGKSSPATDDDASPDDDDDQSPADDDDDATPPTTEGFVFIARGSFAMGSPENEPGRRSDETLHQVTLTRDFELMAAPVMQETFQATMGYNPSWYPVFGQAPKRPVESVSWFDALAFANVISAAKGYAACYAMTDIVCADATPGDATTYCKSNGGILSATVALNAVSAYECVGFRLPTEAEYEYAARAGTTTALFNGAITETMCTPLDPKLDEIAWYCGNAVNKTHDVGGKKANAWGLFDMTGNVAEWTWDWYQFDYGGDASDPTGAAAGNFKAVRGGSHRFDGGSRCRSASRAVNTPDFRTKYVGFRIARTLSPSNPSPRRGIGEGSFAPRRGGIGAGSALKDYPNQLPFTFTRPAFGTPLTPDEIAAFTKKITGFWKQSNYFHWLLWTAHGMASDNPQGYPDYKMAYSNVNATKSSDAVPVVTFAQTGSDDNVTGANSRAFNGVLALYLLTGDAAIGRLVSQLSKGYVALADGMNWTDQDPERAIIARAIFPEDNDFVEEGRHGHADYSAIRHTQLDWNAQTIENTVNPAYGDLWVRNRRSKDDVCDIFRTVPMLERVVQDGADAAVRADAAKALDYLQNFARDIVDSGYYIRTKDVEGNQQVPVDDHDIVLDLASFVQYTILVPNAECDERETTAMIAYGGALDTNCGGGVCWLYEIVAGMGHYYNTDQIRFWHAADVYNALMAGQNDRALALLKGMVDRVEYMMYKDPEISKQPTWWADAATFLVAAASTGFPLTSDEARMVVTEFSDAAEYYAAWPYWDPWAPSVPPGAVPIAPDSTAPTGAVPTWDAMPALVEYCYSPLRNPATAPMIDCDIVRDPAQWGT